MDEKIKDINVYGCVLFDVTQSSDGVWSPKPGSGWAAIDGEKSKRIGAVSDLRLDVVWLSNLDQKTHWKATLYNIPQIKDSRYLRTNIEQIMREIGVSAKTVGPANSAEAIAEVFGRVMNLAKEYFCQELGWTSANLISELSIGLNLNDSPYEDSILDEAFARSYQDRVDCYSPLLLKENTERWLTFRRPRLLHAQEVMGESFLEPRGPWKFVGEREMPPKDERLAWVEDEFSGRPYMLKVKKINFFSPLETDLFDPASLLQFGDSILPGRQRLKREWMPMPELLYMRNFSDIEIDSICVGSHYEKPDFFFPQDLDYMMYHSYSWGILAENIWMTYASRSVNTKAKNKTLVSARASWLRSIDRFYCFVASTQMSLPGNNILFYGAGSVTISCSQSNIGKNIQHGVEAGLQAPSSSYSHWKKWNFKEEQARIKRESMLDSGLMQVLPKD